MLPMNLNVKLLRAFYSLSYIVTELAEQQFKGFDAFIIGYDYTIFYGANTYFGHQLSIVVKMKVEIIGYYKVV